MSSEILFQESVVEIGPLAADLQLTLKAWFSEDEAATVAAPNIVSASETYYVKIEWDLTGHLERHFCGVWLVQLHLESIGTAPEYSSPVYEIAMDPCRTTPYSKVFQLKAGDVQPGSGGTVYFVATTLSSMDPCGGPGHLWGYAKGPSVMFIP